jgi:hypothetical protein
VIRVSAGQMTRFRLRHGIPRRSIRNVAFTGRTPQIKNWDDKRLTQGPHTADYVNGRFG